MPNFEYSSVRSNQVFLVVWLKLFKKEREKEKKNNKKTNIQSPGQLDQNPCHSISCLAASSPCRPLSSVGHQAPQPGWSLVTAGCHSPGQSLQVLQQFELHHQVRGIFPMSTEIETLLPSSL